MLCLAFAGTNSVYAQITKDGVKIRLFEKNDKGKSQEIKSSEISNILESGLICCMGVSELDRIELSGDESVTIKVREGFDEELGDVVFLIKNFPLNGKKATFKPLEGRDDMGWYTVFIMKGDKVILQFKYRYMSCT